MLAFTYAAHSGRVIFGTGTIDRLPAELDRLGCRRALLLATPQQADLAAETAKRLDARSAAVFAGAAMHTPQEVTEQGLSVLRASGADCMVAIGGSTTGLGKALALRTDLPLVAVPTTYAGSEMTPILGETRNGAKATQRTLAVLPEVVIYDVALTLGLPWQVTAASGLNAVAHGVEALYAEDTNPVVCLMAEEGIAALARSLPVLADAPSDHGARADALYGAWLCGTCLGAVGMGLHHKLCHVLGGTYGLPHAETHAAVLPYAAAYNQAAAPAALARVAHALGADSAATGLHALAVRLGTPRSLRELGMPHDAIDGAAALVAANPYGNPAPITRDGVAALLAAAWNGAAPDPAAMAGAQAG